jgi:ferritin-like metal-binding protein YciE
VLPKLERQATSEWLVDVVRAHLAETEEHVSRLEQVFRAVGAEPSSNLAAPVQKLAEHHDELAGSIMSERLADAYHAIAAATTEHYELAAYDGLLALAQTLELDGDALALLAQNRDEDANALVALHGSLQKLLSAT